MNDTKQFRKEFLSTALPISLQGVFQASFSVADQLMVGQLGSVAVAGIGLGGKFSSLYQVLLSAVATAAGILIAQAAGSRDREKTGRSFCWNLLLALLLAAGFTAVCAGFPRGILRLYSEDDATIASGGEYLRILAWSFLPSAATAVCATLLRCQGAAGLPLYAGVGSAVLNTILNYGLIFGRLGMPEMGVSGAAWATVLSQWFGCLLTLGLLAWKFQREGRALPLSLRMDRAYFFQYGSVLLPIFLCEFFWSLGENGYAAVYGHIGTDACAAMTLTNPIQALTMGALTGISQASGILVGKELGREDRERAYRISKKMMLWGAYASAVLSVLLILLRGPYVKLFPQEPSVTAMTQALLLAYAVVAPVKVQNMILGGGIIRSGGKTKYIMAVDLIGTWCFGIPLALLSGFALKLPIYWVYFILSQEELVRLLLSLDIFRKKRWMQKLQ